MKREVRQCPLCRRGYRSFPGCEGRLILEAETKKRFREGAANLFCFGRFLVTKQVSLDPPRASCLHQSARHVSLPSPFFPRHEKNNRLVSSWRATCTLSAKTAGVNAWFVSDRYDWVAALAMAVLYIAHGSERRRTCPQPPLRETAPIQQPSNAFRAFPSAAFTELGAARQRVVGGR